MIHKLVLAACTAAGFVSVPASAQRPTQQPAQPPAEMLQALDALRVPLHSAPTGPHADDYGLWAAGPDYKASFHDGFAFHPYRGPDAPPARLHWRTESVTIGGAALLAGAPVTRTTDWRHELRYGAVSEVYDVLREGVEQSFVLHRPAGAGDLVVTGRVSGLTAVPVEAAWQELEFGDGGEAAVRYGKAIAFDAAGRRVPVDTEFDGTRIRLTLGAEFLARAVYPVVVDPLTTASTINSASAPVSDTAIAVDNSSTTGKTLVVYTRRFSSGDEDAYGVLCDRDFGSPVHVWTALSAIQSIADVEVAHVDGAGRFAIALQLDYGTADRRVRVYLHDERSTSLNSGVLLHASAPIGFRLQRPRIGGARGTGTNALVVCELERNNTSGSSSRTRVGAIRVDALRPSLGAWRDLHVRPVTVDSEIAAVVPSTVNTADWVAIWRDHSSSPTANWINIARIAYDGSPYQNDQLLITADSVGNLAIAGSWSPDGLTGRYTAAWAHTSASGRSVRVRRFDLPHRGGPALRPVRTVASSSLSFFDNVELAHDWLTLSHWALTYTKSTVAVGRSASVVRLGHTGGTTESLTLASSSGDPSGLAVAFVEGLGKGSFGLTYGIVSTFFARVMGRELRYPLDALSTSYGPVCRTGTTITSNLPFAGHEFFRVEVSPVGLREPVYFVLGFAPTSLPLGPYGFPPTCHLSVDLSGAMTVGFLNPDPSGRASVQFALPDAPLFTGDLFIQAIVLPGGGVPPFVSHGLGVQVR